MKRNLCLLGSAIILMIAIITVAGCELPEDATFPSGIQGTWKRVEPSIYTNTLTFTKDTLKASNQSSYWKLKDVSGDTYTLEQSDNSSKTPWIILRLVDGNLEITEAYHGNDQDNWNGTWVRK